MIGTPTINYPAKYIFLLLFLVVVVEVVVFAVPDDFPPRS